MMRTRFVVLPVLLFAVACATSAPPPKPSAAPPIPIQTSGTRLESDDYRRALEEAYDHIVARESVPVNAPRVDVEAAASIPIPDHRTIRGAITYFSTDLKPSIQESLIRSARYKKLIDRVLDDSKLPRGLAYLPVIESAYVPTLTSRAGAHGIWQFMPDTAREYGLRVDWWVDERADPERSTRAAAAYLKDLYRQFNDWPLALAAYNAGPGRIRRALEDTGSTTFWQLLESAAVPKETRGYVPTFFATLTIASDPATYGFRLGEPMDVDHKQVEIEGPLSLHYLADAAGVSESLLRDLNPALEHGVVPPGKAMVRVPSRAAEVIAARAATLKTDDANIAVCTFTMREGDSVRKIARAIGTSVETIVAMNNARSAKAIGEGDSIYLPVRARELGALLAQNEMYYAVKKGDTIYSIAKSHNLTIDELFDLNEIERGHMLHPGEKLRVAAPRALTAGGM